MDQKKSLILAQEGFELYKEERFIESEEKYIESLSLADPRHVATTDMHSQFSQVLRKLKKEDEALEQLQLAIESALKSNSVHSEAVTFALFSLAEYRMLLGDLDLALELIKPSLESECDSKWLICFVASQIYYKLGEIEKSDEYATQVMFLSPRGEFPSLIKLKEIIRA